MTTHARRHRLADQRGSMLLMSVMAMLMLSVLAVSLTMVASLEGQVAFNHESSVRALFVAEGGIEGLRRELTDYVNTNGWTGTWTPALQALGTVCNAGNGVAFAFVPSGGSPWARTGSTPSLFFRDNDTSLDVTWENGNECTDTDGIVTLRANGRVPPGVGTLGATRLVSVDVTWQVGGSPSGWDNAVDGGGGPPGAVINGNAMVYGGVALRDNGGGVVWSMGGTSGIRNNYQNGAGAPASERLRGSTRAFLNPTLLAEGDVALNAKLAVQRGTVTFGGGATAGLPQASVTDRKQRLDLALANDFDPAGVTAIHADRSGPYTGTSTLPRLGDVVGGGDTRTWEQMLNQDGLVITPAEIYAACVAGGGPSCRPDVIDGYTGYPSALLGPNKRRLCLYRNPPMGYVPPSPCQPGLQVGSSGVFSRFVLTVDTNTNPNTATLEVEGIIVFRGFHLLQGIRIGGLTGGGPSSLGRIVYSGAASVFVDDDQPNNCATVPCAGRLTVAADIVTAPGAYPTAVNPPVYPPAPGTVNQLGLMAEQVGLGYGADGHSTTGVGSDPSHTALFYAQTVLYLCKNTEVFGSLMSPVVNLSCQVPKIAAVKTMSQFLPRGLIGTESSPSPGRAVVTRWREGRR